MAEPKALTSTYIVSSEKQLEIQEVFGLFDIEGNGTVSINDVTTLVRAVGQTPSEAKIKQMKADMIHAMSPEMDPADPAAEDIRVTFPKFLDVFTKHAESPMMEEDIYQAFKVFDKTGTGYIPIGELKKIMTVAGTPGEALNEDELESFV
eukprot:CAMPEP_0184694438 /NCGR_PEP_ID=MMETSP0313-20130426/2402_1 /TAXON_ID=2792 /ORGANISM="Porphyridium aerugineum, Strain SAG 1380-2" /LENGTH=149 /DNA_ID=CAMNT_0027152733 /DNA_START=151 /DNA_END=597 /DNA_ORIENTATION=-